jgi:predicted PurR-regulated permease PerM
MVNDWGKIKSNFYFHIEYFQQLINDNFHLSNIEQKEIIGNAAKNSLKSGNQIVGITINSFSDIVLNLTLIPIYTFLFLLYQNHFIAFLTKLYKPQNHKKLREILFEIKTAVQSYVVGLIFEMIAVSFLTSIGFYLIGVEYFILLGIITGILNLIPYVGILFAGVLSIVVSLSGSTDLSVALGVIVVNLIVQFLDNNILIPMLVNSKVQINAFAPIIGIIIGNVLGGITGMFLAIPIIAIIKVIFDRIDHLEPWGYLLGDDVPKTYEWHNIKLPHYNYQTSSTTIDFDTDFTPSIQSEDSAENEENSTNDTVEK